jgi:hypothetical protein
MHEPGCGREDDAPARDADVAGSGGLGEIGDGARQPGSPLRSNADEL